MKRLMTSSDFSFRAFAYRLDLFFALQHYAIENQRMRQLRKTYNGNVPLPFWHSQRRRIMRAQINIIMRRNILEDFLKVLNN